MRKAFVILAVLLLAGVASANTFLQTTQGGVSLNAAAATGRGTCFTISGNGPDKFPNLYTFTVTTSGSPTGYTVVFEGSQVGDGSDAVTLGTITQATAQTIYVSGVSPANVCANLTALSGGTSPKVTATIIPYVSANIAYPGQPLSTATITGGTINGTVIGGTTPAAISGTTITAGTTTLNDDTLAARTFNLGNYLLWSDTFTDLSNWATSGTVAASGNVMQITPNGTAYHSFDLTSGQPPIDKVYVVQATLTATASTKLQFGLSFGSPGPYKGYMYFGGSGANTVNLYSASSNGAPGTPEGPHTITPPQGGAGGTTAFSQSQVFDALIAVDPTTQRLYYFLRYAPTPGTNPAVITQLDSSTVYSYANTGNVEPTSIYFNTSAAGVGPMLVKNVQIYRPTAVIIGNSRAAGSPYHSPVSGMVTTDNESNSIGYWLEQAAGGKIKVLNMALGGSTTAQWYTNGWYQSLVLPFKPEWVIYGDCYNDTATTIATTETQMTAMVAAWVAAGSKVLLMDCAGGNLNNGAANTYTAAWNAWLPSLAGSHVYVAHVHDAMADPGTPTNLYAPLTPDNIHFYVRGYREQAQQIWKAMTGQVN